MRRPLLIAAGLLLAPLAGLAEAGTARLAVMAVVPATCVAANGAGVPAFACSRGTQASVHVTKLARQDRATAAAAESPPEPQADGVTQVTVTYQP